MPREPEVFGQPTSPTASQGLADDQGDLAHLRVRHSRHRIEVDPQLVGVVQVVSADRVRIEVDAAQVDDPGQTRCLIDDDLVGRAAGRKGECRRAHP